MTAPVTGIELTIGTAGVKAGTEDWARAMQRLRAEARGVQGQLQELQRATTETATAQQPIATTGTAAERALRQMGLIDAQVAEGVRSDR